MVWQRCSTREKVAALTFFARRRIRAGTLRGPIRFTVVVSHMARNGESFDLLDKRTHEPWYPVTVNGAGSQIYSRTPY